MEQINLPVAGLQKQSLVDFPGQLSAVAFTRGCNLRCVYCHNPDLVYPCLFKDENLLETGHVVRWIQENASLLDAVTITGGEPTMHPSLPVFIRTIKKLGLKVKLDTNGTNPGMLEKLVSKSLLDHVAMDVKAPLALQDYQGIAGKHFNQEMLGNVKKSIFILCQSSLSHEFRTTLVNGYHTLGSVHDIAAVLKGCLYLQNFKNAPGMVHEGLQPFKGFEAIKEGKYGYVLVERRG